MNNKNNRKLFALVLVFVLVIAALAAAYFAFKPKAQAGSKSISIEVIDNQSTSKKYAVKTDAEYLRQAMSDAEGLEFSGSEGEYGLYIDTVNSVTADYNADGAYWSFYINGEYCNYGVDTQPVADGDAFVIKYEVYVAQ